MNLHTLVRRLLRRPTCVMGEKSRLTHEARILNIRGPSDQIRIGSNTVIRGELMVFAHGGQIEIGDWCFVGPGAHVWSGASIMIGDRVLIAHNVNIFDNLTHPIQPEARHAQFKAIATTGHPTELDLEDRPVTIGDDVWIGAGATVLRGVTIGCGAIVGAASLVAHDVPPYCVVVGNPARVVRQLVPGPNSQAD